MSPAPQARRINDLHPQSKPPARPVILSRSGSPSILSTSRLVSRSRNTLMIIMAQLSNTVSAAAASPSSSPEPGTRHQHVHVLKARQSSNSDTSTQSLTFGFAFMAILLFLLFFAHMMQRVATRRQREVLARMAALRDVREVEEVPKLWDVHLRRLRYHSGPGAETKAGKGSGSEPAAATRWKAEERARWKDIQPLSAHAITSDPHRQTSAGPHDRPLRVSVIITMPVSPTQQQQQQQRQRIDNEKRLGMDFDSMDEELPYFELGVTTIK